MLTSIPKFVCYALRCFHIQSSLYIVLHCVEFDFQIRYDEAMKCGHGLILKVFCESY